MASTLMASIKFETEGVRFDLVYYYVGIYYYSIDGYSSHVHDLYNDCIIQALRPVQSHFLHRSKQQKKNWYQ